MNPYNYDFDYAAIALYFVTLFSYIKRKHINNSQNKIFLSMLGTSLLTAMLDIAGSFVIDAKLNSATVITVNTLYYIFKQGTILFFLLYIISQLEMRKNIPFSRKVVIILPIIIVQLAIILNPFTGWLFTYSDGKWTSGPMRFITYSISILYYLYAIMYVAWNRHYYNKYLKYLVCVICAINTFVEMTQLFHSSLLIHSFAISLSMLLLVTNLEYYGIVADTTTGMVKREHLENILAKMFFSKEPFSAIFIKVADYDLFTNIYGIESVENMIKAKQRYLLSFVKPGKAFQISNNCFVLLFGMDENLYDLEEKIYGGLKKPYRENDVDIVSEYFIASLAYPMNVADMNSFMAYLQHFTQYQRARFGIVPLKEFQIGDKLREHQIQKVIENALKENRFEVFYQPICTSDSQSFVTAEALIRLQDPVLGTISPAEFIPISEQNGSIIQIGNFVLEEVCTFIQEHDMEKLGLEYIELNLSTVQVLQRNFIQTVEEITSRHHIPSKYLCFEITETASNCAPALFQENLKKLTERGYMLALDDFGTGYGNLQRMVTSEFKIIKFDKTMTQQLTSGKHLQKVYRTLQAMIKTMGSKIVSEGIETQEQYEIVKSAGTNYIQGYFFSRPLPEEQFISFLEKSKN